ncbi:heat shock 70 kDa protein 12A-like [Dreissena polymorpha]|uniref:Uncharacterized protein n=1 Tax=Dreissena polymorpha TaxID=45954 RepID=A0A9D4GNP7_DREPO|nr:heat shock 70 kDa protein 12A-like [Dreissena polymorpha]XP_052286753.1 heat shock 70 kDa protein 12A-like [Dreissena polymorpha]KAH3817232.1 hypothetical protein DPMN_118764 [Dreissena polymorpha]
MWTAFFGLFVTFLTLECTPVSGNVQVVKRKKTAIECSSNSDISFKFYSNVLKKSLTIAECDFHRKSCALLTTLHTHAYDISYTGRGGILVIRDIEEEIIGTYQCFDTYNPQNLVSTYITPSEYTATKDNNLSVPIITTEPRLRNESGHIVLGVLRDKTIECSSNVDITFRFMHNTANASVTFAECDLSKKACTISKASFHNKYNLSYTGIGGVLHINSLNNESFGTYICCATYNPSIFVSIDMIAHIMESADNTYNVTVLRENNTEIHWEKGGTHNSSPTLTIALSICGALVIIGLVCGIVWCRRKAFLFFFSDPENMEMFAPTKCSNATATYQNEDTTNTSAPLLEVTDNTPNGDSTHPITQPDDLDQFLTDAAQDVRVVAAIELGTTHSGYAYSFSNDPNNVVINKNWLSGGLYSFTATKTPTIVLLDNNGEFHSFGYDAEAHFLSLAHENKHRGWRLFSRFKMVLHDYKNCSVETTIDDIEGHPYPAIKIFTMALHFLKRHLIEALKYKLPTLIDTNIQYIVTVPAIWTVEAIAFMRESAVKAGINNERLKFVVDSVAASNWWTRLNNTDSQDITLQTPGSKFLVAKIGGATASILASQVLSEGKVKVIHEASGGPWGATNVDQQFINNLKKNLGARKFDKLRRKHIEDYYGLLRNIEKKIRSKYVLRGDDCVLDLPHSLSRKGKHKVKTAMVKTWFDSEILSFISHIETQLHENPSLREITNMILVDRFAESLYVQSKFTEVFKDLKLSVPQEPGLAVLKGAVLYGHNTDTSD